MNREDIIRMGQEVYLCDEEGRDDNSIIIVGHLERFAELVASAEREACAELCDRFANRMMSAEECADAIRARGDNK